MADKWETLEHVRCIRGNESEQDWVPATVSKIDYVDICQLVLYVLQCNMPIPSGLQNNQERRPLYIDFGQRVMANMDLPYTEPILTQVIPKPPDRTKRQMVMCMSRVFAFEKWQLLVTALEVYKLLKVDLVVAHVNSVLTPIFRLMKEYERDGILAIRPGIRLPYLKNMNYDPNTEIEYSGQLMLAHECFYEFRESAEFIALLDWDDLMITTQYPSLGKAFHEAALHFPQAPYFLVNKLETTFMEQDSEPTQFSIRRLIEQGTLTKFAYNNEKMVVRPKNIVAFWVHFTRSMPYEVTSKAVTLSADHAIMLHLARKAKKGGGDGYSYKYLSKLNLTALEESTLAIFRRHANRELILSLPNGTVYFDAISDCSRYMNAFPTVAGRDSPCLSYTMCTFPKIKVGCVVADGEYRTKVVRPTTIYSIHTRIKSGFKERLDGCFDVDE
ncbi:glycosyltransferase family 92 domain-containing protein [Ditylenchus destructor]|uniref:Glycosyltransferase family 92 protein n=1 Tax=Ditylenchus destructor TaxID=166010 RepID=A0AAD4QZX0_9BILA|nr:glycosyltransferase family 92 domain-containing protein [Ditylenchus destructor]